MRRAAPALLLLLVLPAGCGREASMGVVPLDDEIVRTYLEAYPVIAPVYRKAYEAGASPTAIHRRDDIQAALERAGWTWAYYQRVHGSISNALLFIEDEEAFRRLEMAPGDAPPRNVRVVEEHYFVIKKARLIAQEETYGGKR